MIAYVTLGAQDRVRALAFYDALLAELGAQRMFETKRMVYWGNPDGSGTLLGVGTPFDGEASHGNGAMVALRADSQEAVERLHAKALKLGGSDEGAPGERIKGLYAAYVRDLDANKLAFIYMGGASDA